MIEEQFVEERKTHDEKKREIERFIGARVSISSGDYLATTVLQEPRGLIPPVNVGSNLFPSAYHHEIFDDTSCQRTKMRI
uniref:Uncharacterized protein n=1 Tax=Ascaris lumbricoides TaxID=6252 RepID=A0A0M3HTS2_ASCLU